MKVFHAGYEEIRVPDIHRGRVNADFGQGFYLTGDREFAMQWVREKTGAEIIINEYELNDRDLDIKSFKRDSKWFRYVFSNRRSRPDELSGVDMIIGPIANDTIYNTMGIITSGYFSDEEAVKLLCVGPEYRQIVLKSQKAVDNLKFISSEVLSKEAIRFGREAVMSEEKAYLDLFAEVMRNLGREDNGDGSNVI